MIRVDERRERVNDGKEGDEKRRGERQREGERERREINVVACSGSLVSRLD